MPRKKTGKKSYRRSRSNLGKNIIFFFILALSLFTVFITVNQLQKPQTIQQHAETETSIITQPVWGCLGLGSSDICTMADNTFVTDPNNANCLVVEGKVEPTQVEQGQEITGTFIIKNTCLVGKPIPALTIKARHTSGKILEFTEKSKEQLITNQTVTFTTKYKIAPQELLGEWAATLFAPGPNNSEVPFATESSNLKFTVVEPCKGLEVSKAISVDKGHVNVGETVNGSITYKNPCKSAYKVKDMLIQLIKPGTGESEANLPFSDKTGELTIEPGAEKELKGSQVIPPDPCGLGKPTCSWSIIGSYQKVDGKWVLDENKADFTVGAIDPVDAQKPENRIPAGETCQPGGGQLCAEGYVCPLKAGSNGKNTCVQQIPANGVCDPKEGNLCVSGHSCQKDTSSATGNKCLADKTTTTKKQAGATCDPNKNPNECIDGYTCAYGSGAGAGNSGTCVKSSTNKAPNAPAAKMKQEVVYFDFNSSAVKSDYTADLARVVTFMKANPSAKVTIEGHTDNVGESAYNVDLGKRRAEAVRTYLVGKGIASNRFTVVSKGESQPVMSNSTEVGRFRNRRAEIFTP